MSTFADVPEQVHAKRLLEAALAEGPSHAYLFHGPAGAGKRAVVYELVASNTVEVGQARRSRRGLVARSSAQL